MVFADVTATFRDLLAAQRVDYPPTRSKSPFRSKSPNRKGKDKQVECGRRVSEGGIPDSELLISIRLDC